MKIDKTNFFKSTFANFERCETPANFKRDFCSGSGSKYMYTKEGVYRISDHYHAAVASCAWLIDTMILDESELGNIRAGKFNVKEKIPFSNSEICGFCRWENFKKIETNKQRRNYLKESGYLQLS